MFYDLGTISFDEDQRRYVYLEDCSGSDHQEPMCALMIDALLNPTNTTTPSLITEVRYAARKHDPKAVEERIKSVVILGLKVSDDYDQMRSEERLDDDEIKIEVTDGFMDADITITLVGDLQTSMELLSDLRLFVAERNFPKAA